jgi:hypothetical protein
MNLNEYLNYLNEFDLEFITAKGSKYYQTHRLKSDGTVHKRAKTFFISDDVLKKLVHNLQWKNHSGSKATIRLVNNIPVLKITNKLGTTIYKIPFTMMAKVGLTPIEVGEKFYHVGNKIVKIIKYVR